MEATKKLYERDSYRKEFEASVERCVRDGEHWNIVLDQTGFFSGRRRTGRRSGTARRSSAFWMCRSGMASSVISVTARWRKGRQ